MLAFRDVFLADLGQFPFFILCFVAVFQIAGRVRLSREYSFLAASLFVLIPNFFKQLEIGYVDVMLCAFFLISLNFILLLYENFNMKNLGLCATSLGLLFGTKTIGLAFGAVIFLLLILVIIVKSGLKKLVPIHLLQ